MSYWTDRQERLKQTAEKDEAKLKKRLSSFYDAEFKRLEKEIAAYYQQYGEDNVIAYRNLLQSLSEEDRRLLMERMNDFAVKYPQYANLMPVRESIYKLDRLQGLQYSVYMTEAEIAGFTNEQTTEYLTKLSRQGLNYGMETLGFGKNFYSINDEIVKQFVGVPWCNGEDFSSRIWRDTQKLAQYLSTDIAQGFARGDSYDKLVRNIRQRFDRVNRKDAYRLVYTEGTYVMAESTMQPFKDDFEKYRLSPVLDGRTCPICRGVREQVFLISERQPGVNFPPLHPWCVIPDTKIIAPDIEAITKSWYSGDVIKITTANGGRLTVSPNHIVLTARGWVRAKHLVKGDKVVHYCGWRKSLSESDPAHDNSVPTIEELFTSFVESGTVSPVSVPATSEDFKGDVVVNSKIDIINIDSKLRDKLNASFDEFIGDISFVGTPISSKVKLPAHSCLEFLLTGAGLTADGIMSGLDVAKVLLSGSFTHHELIGFRNPSDYDARLFKSTCDSRARNVKDIGEFIDAFPGIVEFDDLINVERDSFFGHVYDASSLSTLYIANGIITSNCRCSFTIEVDDWGAWMDEYVSKNSGDRSRAEEIAKRIDDSENDVLNREYKELSLEEFKKMHHTVTKEERRIIYGKGHFSGYVNSSNARKINGLLRKGEPLSPEYQKIVDSLSSVIQKNEVEQDIIVTRYVTVDALEDITGTAFPKTPGLLSGRSEVEKYWQDIGSLGGQIQKGHTYTEKGFLSTSGVLDKNVMQDKGVLLRIKVPKGKNGYVTTNYKESEIIFDRGARLEILDAHVENNRTYNVKVVLDCVMR